VATNAFRYIFRKIRHLKCKIESDCVIDNSITQKMNKSTENICAICMGALFCSPPVDIIKDITFWCGKSLGFTNEFRDDILAMAHREICRTGCGHSYHHDCFCKVVEQSRCNVFCPLCRDVVGRIICFSRSGKKMDDYLQRGEIEGAYYARRLTTSR